MIFLLFLERIYKNSENNMKNHNIKIIKNTLFGLLLMLASFAQAETTTTYYVNDALGSPVAAMDETGALKWRKHYSPYGQDIDPDPNAKAHKVGFTGHVEDSSTGLTYMGARYYDPLVGRFMGVDPVGFIESSPVSFNRFAYGNNNPYRFVDPDGKWAEDIFIGVPSVGVGLHSLYNNVSDGNYGAAGVDVAGIGGDIAAIVAPGIPGGIGLGIKASREATKKATLSAHKKALKKVHEKVGKLPKGKPGKFGSPQAGNSKKGYRLDPAHDGVAKGSAESKPHINWWDYSGGKRGKGGKSGAIPIDD